MKKLKCKITDNGYLHIPANIADEHFKTGAVIIMLRENELHVMPVSYVGAGGIILKYRNAKGDRSVFIAEFLPDDVNYGSRIVKWDEKALALRIPLYT